MVCRSVITEVVDYHHWSKIKEQYNYGKVARVLSCRVCKPFVLRVYVYLDYHRHSSFSLTIFTIINSNNTWGRPRLRIFVSVFSVTVLVTAVLLVEVRL